MTIYAICDEGGTLLANIAFRHADAARAWFDADAEKNWRAIAAEEGLPEAAVPTLEWHEIEPPEWASSHGPAWAGMTGDADNPVIVAGLMLEERALA